ncbi:MAG: LysR substrate-binding domain-containing protein, partial [Pseudomonadota bacterium]
VAQTTDEQFSQLAGRIKGKGADVSGDLVVTSLLALSNRLVPLLAEFQAMHKDLRVLFVTGDRLFRLEYGEAHVAIRAGSAPDQPDNVVQKFMDTRMGLYASPDYVARHGLPDGPAAFADHRFIGPDNPESRAPHYAWLKENVPASAVTFRCSDSHAALMALEAGAGIGFLPEEEAKKRPDLVMVEAPRAEWSAPLWLVTHVDLHRTTKVQALLRFLKDRVKAGG